MSTAPELRLVQAWTHQRREDHVGTPCRLQSQIERYNKEVKKTKWISTLVAILTLIFLAYSMYRAEEKIGFDLISLTLVLTTAFYYCAYLIIIESWKGKNREVYNSIRAFDKDRRNLKQLMDDGHGIQESRLYNLGNQIAEAHNMKQPEVEKKLMATFRKDHRTLLNFGNAYSQNYGDYIPNPDRPDKTGAVRILLRAARN